jgi:7-carboxy-7-deazaguanine synthase
MRRTEPARQYGVHKIFGPTIQGEGPMAGTPCVFVRFSGCNMWDGRPETRAESHCPFCDTDFFSHTMMQMAEILEDISELERHSGKWVDWIWLSGGEPLLQLDEAFVSALHQHGYKIAVETNGATTPRFDTSKLDHITVSPKVPRDQMKTFPHIDTLKVLYPHPNPLITPEAFDDVTADVAVLQPIDAGGDDITTATNIRAAVDKVLTLNGWRLSLQLHKLIGVE